MKANRLAKTYHALSKDFTGQLVGATRVLKYVGKPRSTMHFPRWLCRCKCGREFLATAPEIVRGERHSCGCGIAAYVPTRRERLFKVWSGMHVRCSPANAHLFKDYAGRGISVCEAWHDFEVFYRDMARSWRDGLTLDRIRVNEGYSKSNCRWATMLVQQNNRRCNVVLSFQGKRMTAAQWSRILGLPAKTVGRRLTCGYSVEDALTTPLRRWRRKVRGRSVKT